MSPTRFHLTTTLNRARSLWALLLFLTFHAVLMWAVLTYVGWPALLSLIVTVPFVGGLSEVSLRRFVALLISDSGRLWHDAAADETCDVEPFKRMPGVDERDAALFDEFLHAATRYGSATLRDAAMRTLRVPGAESVVDTESQRMAE